MQVNVIFDDASVLEALVAIVTSEAAMNALAAYTAAKRELCVEQMTNDVRSGEFRMADRSQAAAEVWERFPNALREDIEQYMKSEQQKGS